MPTITPITSLLIVNDDQALFDSLSIFIRESLGISPQTARSVDQALESIAQSQPEVVLCDVHMPGQSGVDLFKHLRANAPSCEIIMMTAHASVQDAVAMLREGAFDYLIKPFPMDELVHLLDRLARIHSLDRNNQALSRRLSMLEEVEGFVGTSPAALKLRRLIPMVAASDAPVFIGGESGTGKSHFARTLHTCGPRSSKAFITIECASIPRELLESELFGYEKGAFTGAAKRKLGRFELADGGTLFLDEIGDLPLELQSKLLRALQEQAFVRVGGTELISIDVRIIAASNKPVTEMVKDGSFREDLYYRLHVIPVFMPPLRERREDIPNLIEHVISRICARMMIPRSHITFPAIQQALEYSWPGNIRELENVIERSIVLGQSDTIDHLILGHEGSVQADTTSLLLQIVSQKKLANSPPDLGRFLHTILSTAIEQTGSEEEAAAMLSISPLIVGEIMGKTLSAKNTKSRYTVPKNDKRTSHAGTAARKHEQDHSDS